MALLKATSERSGRLEHSSADIAQVVMSLGKWNCSRKCSTSSSEHVKTLCSATMMGEGAARTESLAAIVFAPGGSYRAPDEDDADSSDIFSEKSKNC